MNAFEKGLSVAIGLPDIHVGTPDQLFHPRDLMKVAGPEWFSRKLSTDQVATLLHVDRSTVHSWRKKGWLRGTKRKGKKKGIVWRHSLREVSDCCLSLQTRKHLDNPVEHKNWTVQEDALLRQHIQPELRSKQACRNRKHRLQKLKLWEISNELHTTTYDDHARRVIFGGTN